MKKYIPLIIISFFLTVSCTPKQTDNKVKILSSYFPQYDWTRSITGGLENETIQSLLIKNGVDFHFYRPEALDYNQLESCNLIIYIGGPSEQWITEALDDLKNPPEKVLNLYKVIEQETGAIPPDEHIWFSFDYVSLCCNAICDALVNLVPQNAEKYQQNLDDYLEQIQNLQLSYESITKTLPDKPLIIADRNPFYYIKLNYNINIISAINNCDKNTTAENTAINQLANALNENNLNSIFVLDDSDKKISKAVILAAKKPHCDTLVLDSLQCTNLREAMGSITYLSSMRNNLEVIKKFFD